MYHTTPSFIGCWGPTVGLTQDFMYVRQALTNGAALPAMFCFNRIKHTGFHNMQYNRK